MNKTTQPAVAGPVEPTVRPCAWLREQRAEYEGPATLAPLMFLGDVAVKPHSALHGATYEPLYSAEALAAAVAAERERCAKICEAQEYSYWRATEDQDFTPQDCADAIRGA